MQVVENAQNSKEKFGYKKEGEKLGSEPFLQVQQRVQKWVQGQVQESVLSNMNLQLQ